MAGWRPGDHWGSLELQGPRTVRLTLRQTGRITGVERTIGIDQARGKLGQLAEEVAAADVPVMLTRRGQALAVLISAAEYERLLSERRQRARQELSERLARVRESVADAGLDVSVVDQAIAAARAVD